MRKIGFVLQLILPILLITAVIGCNGDEKPFAVPTRIANDEISGELPILKIGDEWVARVITEGEEHTLTAKVIAEDVTEGKDCYVLSFFFDPPAEGVIGSATGRLNKATMDIVSMETTGEYMDSPYSVASSYSHRYPGLLPFPLEVGKEFEVIETEINTLTMMGETETETITDTYLFAVESIEEVTVPAGVFKCFKVVRYDEQGTALDIEWMSPEVKLYTVKGLDHETGDVTELISYSLR